MVNLISLECFTYRHNRYLSTVPLRDDVVLQQLAGNRVHGLFSVNAIPIDLFHTTSYHIIIFHTTTRCSHVTQIDDPASKRYSRSWCYVCTYVWSSLVAELFCSWSGEQGNKKKSLSPFAPENLDLRDRFGRPVSRQPAHSPHSG